MRPGVEAGVEVLLLLSRVEKAEQNSTHRARLKRSVPLFFTTRP
jgi:hypothetical protein